MFEFMLEMGNCYMTTSKCHNIQHVARVQYFPVSAQPCGILSVLLYRMTCMVLSKQDNVVSAEKILMCDIVY